MAMKEDWSFLDKITMGAKGTKKVTEILNGHGHQIMELERYSSSNKIWSTKIKRLRIPDLLCLNCGRRIESKAKSKLGIIMSDTPNNESRFWDAGLRDDDLLVFIKCTKVDENWIPSNTLNLFTIKSLRDTAAQTTLGPPKSVNEGAERDREWKSYVPSFSGTVTSVQGNKISFVKANGQRTSKTCSDAHNIFVSVGDQIEKNAKIASSIVTGAAALACDNRGYDFVSDLGSNDHENKYCAVKALGFLPALARESIPRLRQLLTEVELDERIKLEALASLIRLGEADLWNGFQHYFDMSSPVDDAFRMEATLILTELISFGEARGILCEVAKSTHNSEIRASAVWGLGHSSRSHHIVLEFIDSEDTVILSHAIAVLEKKITPDSTDVLLNMIGHDEKKSASISRIISKSSNLDDIKIIEELIRCDSPNKRQWLYYAVGLAGKARFESIIREIDRDPENTISSLKLLWDNHNNWLKQKESQIEFIKKQN